ncbi:hypothetical protein [Streptomyces sp. SID14515]|uniref:hypothetical protein n=1 Tax=Streptomyces sp. SID14515 TaxID=2706074 RepID=UPI0013C97B1F|nr:hypothetical protein [Streptomyces sp. SID14515]NEB42556.1 hypothetical protein [Streptomyces sp. SID14515]
MARKVVETVTCDACSKKGLEVAGTVTLKIMEDGYDLCDEHGDRFRDQLAAALAPAVDTSLAA